MSRKSAFREPEPAPIPASLDKRILDPLSSARAAAMTSITVSPKTGSLEICIHLDAPAILRESVLAEPSRLVLDFIGVESKVGLSERVVDGPNVRRIRTSQFRASNPAVARIVFDLFESKAKNFEIQRGNSEVQVSFHATRTAPYTPQGRVSAASARQPESPVLRYIEVPGHSKTLSSKPAFSPQEADAVVNVAEAYRSRGNFIGAIGAYAKLLSSDNEPGWIRGRVLALTREKLLTMEASINGGFGRESLTHPLPEDRNPEGMVWLSIGSRCVVVEKESQTLLVFRRSAEGLQLEHLYPCSTGTQDGAKASHGDEKTPEGIYSFGRILPGRGLAGIYGEMAIPLDYPNSYDVLRGRKGGGIWVHGTDKPITPYLPRQSRGCIVLCNRDLQELARCVSPDMTPILIVQKLGWQTASMWREEGREFEDFLARWRYTGESGSSDDYAGVYSARYRNGATELKLWKAHREEISLREDPGRLRAGLQSIVRCGEYAVLAVDEDYRESSRRNALKRLFLIRENGIWRILAVDWHKPRRSEDTPAPIPSFDQATR